MNTRLVLLVLLGTLTVVRWMWNAGQDLSGTEAYLALCGSTPSIAYFDGPPGTAWSVALGTQIAGPTAMGAALLWPVYGFLATGALYGIVASISGRRSATTAAVLLNLLPVFNEASIHPTCAMPLAMFALGTMACAMRALETKWPRWWVATGLCAAGGLTFAYVAWFYLPAIAVVMLCSHRWRRQFWGFGFWLSILPPLLVLAALLVWNAQNGWIHFIGGTWQTSLTLHWSLLPAGLVNAAIVLSPLVFLVLQSALILSLREIRVAPKAKLLATPAVVALLATAYFLLRGEPPHATGLVATALMMTLLSWLPASWGSLENRAVLNVTLLSAALWTALPLAWTERKPPVVTQTVVQQIESLRAAQQSATPLFLIAQDAAMASLISHHLSDLSHVPPGHPAVYVVESPFADSQYALWPRYDQFVDAPATAPQDAVLDPFTEQKGLNPFLGRSALFITKQNPEDLPQAITAAFGTHRLLAVIKSPAGLPLRVYLCENYETMPL